MTTATKQDQQLLKEILSGKYRESYLIYNRKSTDDTENQKNSIKFQKSENMLFAYRQNLTVAPFTLEGFATDGIVSERHSGFKESIELTFGKDNTVQYRVDRPKFHQLVQLLSKGCFKGVIFLCWDRASRNKGDDTILRKLMKAGVDVRFTLAQYDKTSAGELHMDIDGMFAEHHSRVTREKVTITIRNARMRGLCTNKAGVGYLNPGSMLRKPHDPIRAPLIRQMAELAATGEWTLADLARWLIEQGFTMPPVRRRRTQEEILAEEEDDVRLDIPSASSLPTFRSVHKILTNPFYTGKVLGPEGTWIPSTSHEAIIPQGLFDRVQAVLQKRRTSVHYASVLQNPLRGIIRCGLCYRVYTPYVKKGIMYYGARCDRSCANPNKSFNFKFIADKVGALIANLYFTDNELAEIEARASTDIALLDTRRFNQLEADERRKKKVREDLSYLNANRLVLLRTGAYMPESFVAEQLRLELELSSLCTNEVISDVSMRDTVRDVVTLSELLKNSLPYYAKAEAEEKERVIRTVFSELTLVENTLQYQCKKGFVALQSRFILAGDPTGWLSELLPLQDDIKFSIHEIESCISNNGAYKM